MESYLWKAIRGTGLAYGTSIGANAETGHVYLSIYRSPDSSKAFLEAGRVIKDLVDKKVKWICCYFFQGFFFHVSWLLIGLCFFSSQSP
jgi:hypothetical protein